MKKIMEMVSYLALVLIVTAPSLFYTGNITLEMNKLLMLIGTIVWFASAIAWMGHEREKEQ